MTTALEQAFPQASNWLAANVRQKLAECGIFVSSTASLSGEDFTIQPWAAIAVRGNNGSLEFYAYDAADTTTADDAGVSCIVVSGRRYKKRIDVLIKDAAISATVTAQPGSPALGDTYIVPAAPTGTDWASKAKTIATYTARGWIFRQPFVGMLVYSAAVDGFYTYTSGGVWSQGLPVGALGDGSIVQEKLLDTYFTVYVESVLNAPPGGTPTANTRYQVGTSPTGAFAGQANKIARWTAAGAWTFIAAVEGATIYRRDLGLPYTYRSGAWTPTIPASGVQQIKRTTESGLVLNNVTGTAGHGTGVALQSTLGKYLRFVILSWSSAGSGGSATGTHSYSLGIFADAGNSPVVTINAGSVTSNTGGPSSSGNSMILLYAVPDNASHNYNVGIVRTSGSDGGRDFVISADVLIEEIVIL